MLAASAPPAMNESAAAMPDTRRAALNRITSPDRAETTSERTQAAALALIVLIRPRRRERRRSGKYLDESREQSTARQSSWPGWRELGSSFQTYEFSFPSFRYVHGPSNA